MQVLSTADTAFSRVARAPLQGGVDPRGDSLRSFGYGLPQANKKLCDCLTVHLPNNNNPFVVQTNASIHAVEAVLLQSEGEEEYPTQF